MYSIPRGVVESVAFYSISSSSISFCSSVWLSWDLFSVGFASLELEFSFGVFWFFPRAGSFGNLTFIFGEKDFFEAGASFFVGGRLVVYLKIIQYNYNAYAIKYKYVYSHIFWIFWNFGCGQK